MCAAFRAVRTARSARRPRGLTARQGPAGGSKLLQYRELGPGAGVRHRGRPPPTQRQAISVASLTCHGDQLPLTRRARRTSPGTPVCQSWLPNWQVAAAQLEKGACLIKFAQQRTGTPASYGWQTRLPRRLGHAVLLRWTQTNPPAGRVSRSPGRKRQRLGHRAKDSQSESTVSAPGLPVMVWHRRP